MTEWWRGAFDETVNAYRRGDLRAGRAACEQLLSLDVLPEGTEYRVRQNLVFYAPSLTELAPSVKTVPVMFPVPPDWTRFNPSIASEPHQEGFRMVVRSGNFLLTWPRDYAVNDGGNEIRTANYLLELAADLEIRHVQAIDDASFRPEPPLFPVAGFEDCRLFTYRDGWWLSAAARDRNPDGKSRVALLQLDGDTIIAESLLSAASNRHEKNWMPVIAEDDGSLRFVYSCFPTVVLRYDDATSMVTTEKIVPASRIARQFSGGSQIIPYDGGHLCLVHEAVTLDDNSPAYTHRWVWFDRDWQLTKLSPPFVFQKRGVEFAAGLAQCGDDLVISYGRWDREAFLATVRGEEVRALLSSPLDAGEIERELRGVGEEVITPFPPAAPWIVSTTLAGNNEEVIGDALSSVVDWVDACLVIDTGITDNTLEVARQIAGDKLIVRTFPWCDDFAAARNFALEAATELGATWAITLDTDERIERNNFDVRGALRNSAATSISVLKSSGTYGKERIFRLPATGRWEGPTHERFADSGDTETLPNVRFAEEEKSDEALQRKATRDVAILTRRLGAEPLDPRWWYYLGDGLQTLGRYQEAIVAYKQCWELDGWDEESAWAMYRCAQCWLELDQPVKAMEASAAGLARHAGLADLAWQAGYAAYHAGRYRQAIYWAELAIVWGQFKGKANEVPRISFRHLPALYEGPYDILRYARRKLGDEAGAEEAERLYLEAEAAREAQRSREP